MEKANKYGNFNQLYKDEGDIVKTKQKLKDFSWKLEKQMLGKIPH